MIIISDDDNAYDDNDDTEEDGASSRCAKVLASRARTFLGTGILHQLWAGREAKITKGWNSCLVLRGLRMIRATSYVVQM